MKFIIKIPAVFAFLLLFCNAQAQKFEIGIGLGAANYRGDLARHFNLIHSKPAGQFLVRYNLSPVWSARANAFFGMIGVNESKIKSPDYGYSFKTFTTEANAMMEYNFFNYRGKAAGGYTRFAPYIFAGVGIAKYYDIKNPTYVDPNTENSSGLKPNLPFGAGIKWAFKRNWTIAAEFTAKKTLTDVIDSFVVNDNNDMSFFYGFTLSKRFLKLECPQF